MLMYKLVLKELIFHFNAKQNIVSRSTLYIINSAIIFLSHISNNFIIVILIHKRYDDHCAKRISTQRL